LASLVVGKRAECKSAGSPDVRAADAVDSICPRTGEDCALDLA